MNVSIVTSFTIGGLLLISILTLNNNMALHSAETTIEIVNQYRHDELFDMVTHDLSRIGYGFPSGGATVEIKQLMDHKIQFTADILEDGVKEVTWNLTANAATQTPNPNDKILKRTGAMGSGTPANMETDYFVIDFKITGYKDMYGDEETASPGEVQSILVEIIYESEIPSDLRSAGQDRYQRRYWRKLIVPKNLQY